jgi:hypothetical protein
MPGVPGSWKVVSDKTKLNAPTALVHDEHDDRMNTKETSSDHREHRVIVGIVL